MLRQNEARVCVLLDPDGLCHVQKHFGHEALCRVCREYPRFHREFGNLTEHGISLSCPTAYALATRAPLQWETWEDDAPIVPNDLDPAAYLRLRRGRELALELLGREALPLWQRIALVLRLASALRHAPEAHIRHDYALQLRRWETTIRNQKAFPLRGYNSPGDCCGFYRKCGSYAGATGILPRWWRRASHASPVTDEGRCGFAPLPPTCHSERSEESVSQSPAFGTNAICRRQIMRSAFDRGGRQGAVPTLSGRAGRRGRRPLRGAVRSPAQLDPIGAPLIRPFGPPSPLGEGFEQGSSSAFPLGGRRLMGELAERFAGLEILSPVWKEQLDRFRASPQGGLQQPEQPETYARYLACSLYKYWLDALDDGNLLGRVERSVSMTLLGLAMDQAFPAEGPFLQRISREVEHCEENLDALLRP